MERRKLKELNLLDDFFFSIVSSHRKYGEKVNRLILETIYGRRFGELLVIPQKTISGEDTDQHGIRMDVYLEEREASDVERSMIYDIEPDQSTKSKERSAWPRRSRFYHGKIDSHLLESGGAYHELKRVSILVITPYDPFGWGRMIYTIRNVCEEEPKLQYEDGARTIFLYTKGRRDNPPKELQELLRYMEDTKEENAVNDTLKELHWMIEKVREEGKTMLGTLRMEEREKACREEGHRSGLLEGRRSGLLEGHRSGLLEGLQRGREEERKNTEQERRNAEQERRRAESAEAEVLYLKSLLERSEK